VKQKAPSLLLQLRGNQVLVGDDVQPVIPAVRRLADARYAFCDEAAAGMDELYYMYRDVARCVDKPVLLQHGLRFDVTLIPPGLIGQEFNKTVGHYHPLKPGTSVTYPEVYEVLHGEATYLLQRPCAGGVDDVVAIKATAGDKVVIPPGYGHITINAGTETLLMSNWVASDFESVYADYKALRGGAYYLVSESGLAQWRPNPRYAKNAPLRFAGTKDYPEFGLTSLEPMYNLILKEPALLKFVTQPELTAWEP